MADSAALNKPARTGDGGTAETFRLRVEFCKQGRAAMLSHLEVARALERAVRRAGLPYAVSQGFSPHMKISFGLALPVGVGGTHECFDINLTRYIDPDDAARALAQASVPDLAVLSCVSIGPKDPAASAAYPYSTYEVVLDGAADALRVPQNVTVVRKKKERTLEVSDFLVDGLHPQGNVLTFTLQSKDTGSLRPDVLMRAMLNGAPELHVRSITRIAQSATF